MSQILKLTFISILIASAAIACGPPDAAQPPIDSMPEAAVETTVPTATPEPEPTVAAPEKATYELYFDATWSAETHPADYDAAAHFSPFIAYGHADIPDALIFQENGLASDGMEQMAETGATDLLIGEVEMIIADGLASDYIKGARIDSPGTNSGKFGFSQSESHVTFVSMIAPSPDWFVAVTVDLFQDGQWVDELILDLISYDSGTDSGLTLTAADADTQPRETILRLPENLQNMGTLTFNTDRLGAF